jgi:hypothetical protein
MIAMMGRSTSTPTCPNSWVGRPGMGWCGSGNSKLNRSVHPTRQLVVPLLSQTALFPFSGSRSYSSQASFYYQWALSGRIMSTFARFALWQLRSVPPTVVTFIHYLFSISFVSVFHSTRRRPYWMQATSWPGLPPPPLPATTDRLLADLSQFLKVCGPPGGGSNVVKLSEFTWYKSGMKMNPIGNK